LNCDSMGEFLSAYMDDELNREEKMMVESQLRECPACEIMLQDFQDTSKVVYEVFSEFRAPLEVEKLVAKNIFTLRQNTQARRLLLLYLTSGVLGMLVVLSLGVSPVGHFIRASIRLAIAILYGSINLMSVVGNVWTALITVLMLVVFSLSIAGIIRLFRRIQSEALS
jgi:predicted anti-sigma-YlaC factor YlaD